MFETAEIVVESVVIAPTGALQLTYYEQTDMSEFVAYQRVLTIDMDHIVEEVEELQELLRDIIDKAWVLKRNPPKRLRRVKEEPVPEPELEPIEGDEEGLSPLTEGL